jgi:hypothetical protein
MYVDHLRTIQVGYSIWRIYFISLYDTVSLLEGRGNPYCRICGLVCILSFLLAKEAAF